MDTLTRWIFRALGVTLLAWLTGCGGGGAGTTPRRFRPLTETTMQRLIRCLTSLTFALAVAACGGGGGGADGGGAPRSSTGLAGDPAAPALGALVNKGPQPAASTDIVNGLMLTRLDVAIRADATVGQVNAALAAVGGTIVAMRAGLPAVTIAIPRQNDADALTALAATLQSQPGIRLVLVPREADVAVAPPAPANAQADFAYLQSIRFPAAWNARAAVAGLCVNDKVTVIVADMFHRPIDALYADFAIQVPGVANLGIGSVGAGNFAGFHGYDVLATLAAKLDITVPTGANPFADCLDLKAVQIKGLTPYDISLAIDAALAAISGKAIVNASFGFRDECGDPTEGVLCTPDSLSAPKALERAAWGAWQRALLQPLEDRVLVTAAAGNHADDPVTTVYPGAGLARATSAFNVAASADSAMSFMTDAALWEPVFPCTTPPCFPSLTATPDEVATLGSLLADLQQTAAPRSNNVMIVGSVGNSLQRSAFSEPGADVFAVGAGIPTLLGVPATGTSFSAPQVAGLASYLWMLSPELRALPVQATIAAIKANAPSGMELNGVSIADGIIDAYAAVLSLDRPEAVTPASARVRLAILDVNGDGVFTLADVQAFHGAYIDSGLVLEPTAQDYSRFDLNGDGFTGGSRAVRMDLDPTGSAQFGAPVISEVFAEIGGVETTFNEQKITDAQALCYYANTALYTGTDLPARDALLNDLCGTPADSCPLYEVDVGGRIGNSPSRVFHVGAEAGFGSVNAYGSAFLGGNPGLSLTSGYAGTAIAKGNVTYLVEADTPGPIDTVFRWSGSSHVDAGGSCRVTISVGGVTRLITAPTSVFVTDRDHQELEIPVTVRHGDVLQARLDAICSSPGLLPGPPEVLVSVGIAGGLHPPGTSGVRIRPVMCSP